MYFNSSDAILVGVITLAVLAVGIIFAVVTIGGTRAITKLVDIARNYALADLALRREQATRQITFANHAECLAYVKQLAHDLAHEVFEFTELKTQENPPAMIASTPSGLQAFLTPAPEKLDAALLLGEPVTYHVDSMSANIFVMDELQAVARALGLTALPRTERWTLVVVAPRSLADEVRRVRRQQQSVLKRLFA